MTELPLQTTAQHLLVFGATGAIGQNICQASVERGWRVTGASRSVPQVPVEGVEHISVDAFAPDLSEVLAHKAPYSAVCWAQGANHNDSVYNVDPEANLELYRANVLYILVTLTSLLQAKLLAPCSRLCIISSIWQNLARQSKLSYCVTKSALQGLVLSASADLAADGHLINAVLPGALETPMTRRNLYGEQIDRLTGATGFGRLPSLQDVSSLVTFLCSEANTGITGQFIAVDLGFSHVRLL
jgi:NAD(P)-dependent dehydrogenase (short-subunit alcohol dehydrogenase family)